MWRIKKTDTRLGNGARVAVIGGGPAGCFFALHLLRYARQEGIQLQLTLFEPRDFSRPGPQSCGKSAGLLSSGLQRNLHSLGLSLPATVVQNKIDSYVMHLADGSVEISPPAPDREIITVHRGRGPLLAPLGREVNFDEWLLKEVEQAGGHIVHAAAQKLIAARRPVVQVGNQDHIFDLLVLANGINSRRLSLSGFNYRPPKTETMVQYELGHRLGDGRQVHIYFGLQKGMVFGAAAPKGSITSISLLGHNPDQEMGKGFGPKAGIGQSDQQLCRCKPRIAVSMARGYYAGRFVAVGDAAATRLYKDGIGSAFLTARQAAYTAIYYGTRAIDFRFHYAPLCRIIALDNFFGRLLFKAWSITGRIPFLARFWLHTLAYESTLSNDTRRWRQALWNMFTGDDSYRHIFFSLVHPRVFWRFLNVAWRLWIRRNLSQVLRW